MGLLSLFFCWLRSYSKLTWIKSWYHKYCKRCLSFDISQKWLHNLLGTAGMLFLNALFRTCFNIWQNNPINNSFNIFFLCFDDVLMLFSNILKLKKRSAKYKHNLNSWIFIFSISLMLLNNLKKKKIKPYSATAEQKLPRTLCCTVSLFHVTSSQDLTWIICSPIFSSILIRKVLEGKEFIFPFITLLVVSAGHGLCEAGWRFIPLVSAKDRCVTVVHTLAGFWVPGQELLF